MPFPLMQELFRKDIGLVKKKELEKVKYKGLIKEGREEKERDMK